MDEYYFDVLADQSTVREYAKIRAGIKIDKERYQRQLNSGHVIKEHPTFNELYDELYYRLYFNHPDDEIGSYINKLFHLLSKEINDDILRELQSAVEENDEYFTVNVDLPNGKENFRCYFSSAYDESVCYDSQHDHAYGKRGTKIYDSDINLKVQCQNETLIIEFNGAVKSDFVGEKLCFDYSRTFPENAHWFGFSDKLTVTSESGKEYAAEIIFSNSFHNLLCADTAFNKILDKLDGRALILPTYYCGWINIFGVDKYVFPTMNDFLKSDIQGSGKKTEIRLQEFFEHINTSVPNTLMFAYSLFASCKSLLVSRSNKSFLLNVNVPYDKKTAAASNLRFMTRAFYEPEKYKNTHGNSLFCVNVPFKAKEMMKLTAGSAAEAARDSSIRDLPIVLTDEHVYGNRIDHVLTYYEPNSRIQIKENVLKSHLRSKLSFITINGICPEAKGQILDFDYENVIYFEDMEDRDDFELRTYDFRFYPKVIERVVCEFIRFMEIKLHGSLADYSESKMESLSLKREELLDEFKNNRFRAFLKKLREALKDYYSANGDKAIIITNKLNYRDIIDVYESKAYRRIARLDYSMSKIRMRRIVKGLVSIVENRVVFRDFKDYKNYNPYFYRDYFTKELLDSFFDEDYTDEYDTFNEYKSQKDYHKNTKKFRKSFKHWEKKYRLTLIRKYSSASRREPEYVKVKLREAKLILKNVGGIPSETANALKYMLAVSLCFRDFIAEKCPEASPLAETFVQNVIDLHKVLYIRENKSPNLTKELDLPETASYFCKYLEGILGKDSGKEEYAELYAASDRKKSLGKYDRRNNMFLLDYSGTNDNAVYEDFTLYLKGNLCRTKIRWKQLLGYFAENCSASEEFVYFRPVNGGKSRRYDYKRRIDGVDVKFFCFYRDRIDRFRKKI